MSHGFLYLTVYVKEFLIDVGYVLRMHETSHSSHNPRSVIK